MVEWLLLPHHTTSSDKPSDTDIATSLDALLAVSQLDELYSVLQTWKHVLLTQRTQLVLCLTSAQEQVQENTLLVEKLQDCFYFLEYLDNGMLEDALQALQSDTEQEREMQLAELPDIPSERLLPRRITLLTQAMVFIPRSSNFLLWAELHWERADLYMQLSQIFETDKYVEWAIIDYDSILSTLTSEQASYLWSKTCSSRGLAYLQRSQGSSSENLTQAITDLNACLVATRREERPQQWADAQLYLGIAYTRSTTSTNATIETRDEYTRQAMAHFTAALTVFTYEEHPYKWALAHMHRGNFYSEGNVKQQARHLELAIADLDAALQVFTQDETPEEWALASMHRGLAYTERMYGERAENIEQALCDHNNAFMVFTQQTFPYEWALTCLNQGFAYEERLMGKQSENSIHAIKLFEQSLQVFKQEQHPREWGLAHMNIGFAYSRSTLGERSENLEHAIREYDIALTVFNREHTPLDWAKVGLNRTLAYTQRMSEYHHTENLDHAINDYKAILEVFTREEMPRYWAITTMNCGIAYLHRSLGSEAENIEAAITNFNAALEVITPETMFQDWVLLHHNRGLAFGKRINGQKADNLEHTIADFNKILAVLTQERWPYLWASSYRNRGAAYLERIKGNPVENMKQAIADIQLALKVFTREEVPREYRDIHIMLARIHERLGQWQETAAALKQAREVTHLLIETASTTAGRDEIISERDTATLHRREAQALLRSNPPDPTAAVCVLEEGRAQSLRAVLDLDTINPAQYPDVARRARAEAFIHGRDQWIDAQKLLSDPTLINLGPYERYAESIRRRPLLNDIYATFLQARDAIRQHDDANFLAPQVTLQDIGRALVTTDAALVYLVTNEESGLALIVTKTLNDTPKVEHIPLPQLTRKAILRLIMGVDEMPPVQLMQTLGGPSEVPFLSGGLWLAQLHLALEFLTMWGETIEKAMQALPKISTYYEAAQALLHQRNTHPALAHLLDQPFTMMNIDERLQLGTVFSTLVINVELKRSLPLLASLGINKIARILQKQKIQDVTLLPFGYLGLFPFPAIPIQLVEEEKERYFGDLFTVTLASSARAKAMACTHAAQFDRTARPLLLAVGNPQPVPKNVSSLVFAEAEADTACRIAKSYHYSEEHIRCLRLHYATRERILETLDQAWYAHIAVHGQYNSSSPRQSRLIVAGSSAVPEEKRSIYLSELLDGIVNLKGLRLLVLSACETALIETGYIPDETLGLASAFLQAGAAGVIASLWAVDDHATYLLMSRFAQLYLDPQRNWTPARALAQAQCWLREQATNNVLKSYDPTKSGPVITEPAFSTVRSLRYTYSEALYQLRLQANLRADEEPDALPYADPIYWAGFFVTGC